RCLVGIEFRILAAGDSLPVERTPVEFHHHVHRVAPSRRRRNSFNTLRVRSTTANLSSRVLLTRVSSVLAPDRSGPRSSRQKLTAGLISRRGSKLPGIGGGTGVHTRKGRFFRLV